ncbi:DUF502 domain-containing protein [Roseiconus nitratireducens]|uniref:DUF502 domain-containing protein n=1 Tax=Roseiconus nitratireducens TaxID=2605748 RepID=A0A5M6CWJ2_9BACT|nr:DUF502 domain-containing protein [Roseiconus nitratireducens]KAA5539336.1 DUF502 domain-containing protein [Roseiconus nitratireducens]
MRRHIERPVGFLRSMAVGGVIFLLPLIVVGWFVGKAASVVYVVAIFLQQTLNITTAYGYAMVTAAALALVVLACFAAGVVARMTLGRKLSGLIERHLTMIFPRYSIYKDQVAGGIGGDLARDRMKPILVEVNGVKRPALEIERAGDGTTTIYFPGAPDPWSGTIGFLPADQVQSLEVEIGQFLAIFERLGRDSYNVIYQEAAIGEPPLEQA